eukprot:scaffold2850_cov119-Isochrysis_galbana.AAC.3
MRHLRTRRPCSSISGRSCSALSLSNPAAGACHCRGPTLSHRPPRTSRRLTCRMAAEGSGRQSST